LWYPSHIGPLNRRGLALLFFLIKRTKTEPSELMSAYKTKYFANKSSQQIGFFTRKALPCKPGRTTGCNYFALPSQAPASAKTCYALSCALGHHCSARFRPKLTC